MQIVTLESVFTTRQDKIEQATAWMHVIRKRLRFVMVELQENATSTSVGIHVLLDSPKPTIFSVKG